MTLFDNLQSYVTKYAKIIGEKAGEFADASTKQINICSQKDKINKLYKKLGKYVYENRFTLGENEIGSILSEIDKEHKTLEALTANAEKEHKPKYTKCECGYNVRSEFEYCPKCGRKM